MLTLALVGMPGSGKSVVTAYLESRGLQRIYFGDLVLKEVAARSLRLTPENERLVRENLRNLHGMAAMAILSLPIIQATLQYTPVVIDGLYSFSEYKFLRNALNELVVIAITSTRQLRYERLAQRPFRPLTPSEAEARDIAEIEYIEKGGPIAIADYTIVNNGTSDALLAEIATLLPSILK